MLLFHFSFGECLVSHMLCILWCLSAQEICIIYQQGFKKCLVDFLLFPSFVTRLIKLSLSPAVKKIVHKECL